MEDNASNSLAGVKSNTVEGRPIEQSNWGGFGLQILKAVEAGSDCL
jgi:hypothetical protein